MFEVDYEKKLKETMSVEENDFKEGDFVKVENLFDTEGNELEGYDNRQKELFKEGKINFVMGNDCDGGYVYGVEGCEYCYNKFELVLL